MKSPESYIFLPSGCIREEVLYEYVRGGFSGENGDLIEAHLEECPLCREACEGIRQQGDLARQQQHIAQLRSRVSGNVKMRHAFWRARSYSVITPLAVAASIVLLVGVFSLWRLLNHRPDQSMARQETTMPAKQEKTETAVPAPGQKEGKMTAQPAAGKSMDRATVPAGTVKGKEATPAEKQEDKKSMPVEKEAHVANAAEAPAQPVSPDTAYEITGVALAEKTEEEETPVVNAMESDKAVGGVVQTAATPVRASKGVQLSYSGKAAQKTPARFVSDRYKDFDAYVSKNLQVPDTIRQGADSWKVTVTFMVDSTGSVTHPEVLRSDSKTLNEEALRVIRTSPRWVPATLAGRPVPEKQTVTVLFAPAAKEE